MCNFGRSTGKLLPRYPLQSLVCPHLTNGVDKFVEGSVSGAKWGPIPASLFGQPGSVASLFTANVQASKNILNELWI